MDGGLDRTVFDLHLIHRKRSPLPQWGPRQACLLGCESRGRLITTKINYKKI